MLRSLPAGLLRRKQRGAMMAEMLLLSAVMAGMMVYMLRQQQLTVMDNSAINAASNAEEIVTVAANYVNANAVAISAAQVSGTSASSYCQIGASPTTGANGTVANDAVTNHTCAFDVNWLIYNGFARAGLKPTSQNGSWWVIITRQVYNGVTATGNMELLLVPATSGPGYGVASSQWQATTITNSVKETSYAKAVPLVGANIGLVPDSNSHPCGWGATSNLQYVCGAQGGWRAQLSNFVTGF